MLSPRPYGIPTFRLLQEASFSALKENTYRESSMRREVEFKLQSLSAEMGGAQLREQELSQQLDDMNVQVGQGICASLCSEGG